MGELVDGEPFAAAAGGVEELGGGGSGGGEVIEEAAVDELLGDDGLVAEFGREVVAVFLGEGELVGAEAGELFEVVIAGVGAGEFIVNGEVEFGGELEVDELAGGGVAEEEVELAEGGVGVFLDLEVLGEEVEAGRGVEEEGEGVFVEVAEFLLEVEVGGLSGEAEGVVGERGGFGEVGDEGRGVDEGVEDEEGHGGVEL